ncbi:trypsin-like serine protease [Streptomyces anulatus]|uniref:trypsin-like serine protease n=1 Tax=Streptomyces anulatus TaxID=1892 RepID=UPI002F90B523|nr:trypsin-like serine protease [Streptomyces anulatus]
MAVTTTAIAIAFGPSTTLATAADEAPADTGVPFAVEDGAYPYRANILNLTGADLIAGDGNITYTSCSEPHQIKVWARNLTSNENRICFVAATTGYLSVNIPNAYRIETYDRDIKANVSIDGTTENLTVPRDTAKGFGEANPADPKQAVLLEMRVTGTGTPVTPPPVGDATYVFTGKLRLGETRSCTAVLVDPRWAVTAKSCFADKPSESIDTAVGAPKQKTTITLGRADLNSTGTHTSTVSYLVPRPDRDMALVRLDQPATGITPVTISGAAPTANESLTLAGYGRTLDEWAPTKLHTSTLSAGATTATGVDLAPKTPTDAAICKGDAGAPALRTENGKPALVAIGSQSRQGGCLGETETRTDAVGARADGLKQWVDGVIFGATDFNCDGARDAAIADPDATVNGAAKAGRVQLVYGAGKGNAELSQALPIFSGAAEVNDRFGSSLATFDHNLDGCTDLAVGVPGEAIGTNAGAGGVHIVYGSPAGLGNGKATVNLVQGTGSGALLGMGAEAGDRMGEAIAAGTTIAGVPYLAIGLPGEDGSGFTNAGAVVYLHGTGQTNVLINQASEGVAGAMENNDDFGASLAGSPQHLAIGAPGEAIGGMADAGAVSVFNHKLNAAKIPTGLAGLDQNLAEIEDASEASDTFGFSLSMTAYRPNAAATGTESLLVVGTPGEGTSTIATTGRVDVLRLTPTGFSQLSGVHQGSTGVTGANEAGDRFGHTVSAVSTRPESVSTAQNSLVAVGVPGEDIGTATDAGGIMTFGLIGAPGDSDTTVYPGVAGLPGAPVTGEKVGSAVTATGTHLYIGIPDGPTAYGRAHALPWANTTGGTEPVTTYEPGKDGLPATGQRFGASIR